MIRSIITYAAILLAIFAFLVVWNGSNDLKFKRVSKDGDVSTQSLITERTQKLFDAQNAEKFVVVEDTTPVEVAPSRNRGDGPPVVLWISIPGFRGDYIDKSDTPFFDELIQNGTATTKMRPTFPCLTFPAHTTMATGVPSSSHGITGDRIYIAEGEIVKEPLNDELLKAEPIWKTATRQGVKTMVHDWPLSQNQTGEHAAAVFLNDYNPDASDKERLDLALEAWKKSAEGDPAPDGSNRLRLVMLRLNDIFNAGLANGPRAEETYKAVSKADATLAEFFESIHKEWDKIAPPGANLYTFITTDHGMAELSKNVNLPQLLGPDLGHMVDIVAHDAIANLFFKNLPESEGEKEIVIKKFDTELKNRIYFRTLKQEELPDEWQYYGDRVGDRVLVLKTSYAFTDATADEPVFEPADGPNFYSSFGYPWEDSIRMSGQTILSGDPVSPSIKTSEEVSQLTFHSTVCNLLGIKPALGATLLTLDAGLDLEDEDETPEAEDPSDANDPNESEESMESEEMMDSDDSMESEGMSEETMEPEMMNQ